MYRFTAHGIGKHTEALLVNPCFVTVNKLLLVLITTGGLAPIAGGAGRDPLLGRWRAVALRSRRLLSPGERRARSRASPAVSESCAALTLGLRVHSGGARVAAEAGRSLCLSPRSPASLHPELWGVRLGLPPFPGLAAYLARSLPASRPPPARRGARCSAGRSAPRRGCVLPLALALAPAPGRAVSGCSCGRLAAARRPAGCPG